MKILADHHASSSKLRPVGTALSPNGIGMADGTQDMISLAAMDHICIDEEKMEVTCGAGARVSQVLAALSKKGLTLENFSSIQEQQMGGWTQVAAHGTGCGLSTVEEQVVRMKLATPTNGLMVLSADDEGWLFKWAKVGLGALGVVTELTLKVMPAMSLKESTTVLGKNEVLKGHAERLQNYRHCRYMWVPNTEDTVVVLSNPTTDTHTTTGTAAAADATAPLSELLLRSSASKGTTTTTAAAAAAAAAAVSKEEARAMSFAQLRDALLDLNPTDSAHIRAVNRAEAAFWRRAAQQQPQRVADSTDVLGFDCGGQQWVLEVCFPIGSLDDIGAAQRSALGFYPTIGGSKDGPKDLQFVQRVLKTIDQHGIAAPSPIEQRWSARSTSPMSPAFSVDPKAIFCWVGVIMYLPPSQTEDQRTAITRNFHEYIARLQPLFEEVDAKTHWAKVELPPADAPDYDDRLLSQQRRIRELYPVDEFMAIKAALDPRGILSNKLVESLFTKKG
jgi:L-galactono-1,4-lactone dehydrogenase